MIVPALANPTSIPKDVVGRGEGFEEHVGEAAFTNTLTSEGPLLLAPRSEGAVSIISEDSLDEILHSTSSSRSSSLTRRGPFQKCLPCCPCFLSLGTAQ
jgi:hypothetical protein